MWYDEAVNKISDFIRNQPSKQFAQGEILIQQDSEPEHLFAIRSGFVRVHDIAEDGSEQLTWLAKKYDILPIEWLFHNGYRNSQFFYTAHNDVEAFVVDRAAFMGQAKEDPETLLAIIEAITGKYHDLLQHVNAAQKPKARDKIIYALYFLAMRFTEEERAGMHKIELPLSHYDIASLVGTKRETASLELKKLKNEGVIDYDKHSFYINTDKLSRLIA